MRVAEAVVDAEDDDEVHALESFRELGGVKLVYGLPPDGEEPSGLQEVVDDCYIDLTAHGKQPKSRAQGFKK